jgi:hypothetical protein
MYNTCMYVLDVRTWPRWDVPSSGLIDGNIGLLTGGGGGLWHPYSKGLIGLIEYSYNQGIPSFSETQLQRTPGLSMFGLEQFQDG